MKFASIKHYPEFYGPRFAIRHNVVTEEQAARVMADDETMRRYGLKAETYISLWDVIQQQCVMSDVSMEVVTNEDIVLRARGRVLIAGLGLGIIPLTIQDDPRIESITIIEPYVEIIRYVTQWAKLNRKKVNIIRDDIFRFHVSIPSWLKFDTIYFDIWNVTSAENVEEMEKLHEVYAPFLAPGGWMASWRYEDCLVDRALEKAEHEAHQHYEPGFKCGHNHRKNRSV